MPLKNAPVRPFPLMPVQAKSFYDPFKCAPDEEALTSGNTPLLKQEPIRPKALPEGNSMNGSPHLEQTSDKPFRPHNLQAATGSNVVQCAGIFDALDPDSEDFLEQVLALLGMEGSDVLNQNMDLQKNNTNHPGEGTIQQYVQGQLRLLAQMQDGPGVDKALKISTVVMGVARGLATRVGDPSAENRIARALMRELRPPETDDRERAPDQMFQYVDSLGRSNPVLKYLHREINAQDAAVLVYRRANRAGLPFKPMLDILSFQALTALRALTGDMLSVDKRGFPIDNTPGQYSMAFRDAFISEDGWTQNAQDAIDKIARRAPQVKSGFRPVRDAEGTPYAILKAVRHDGYRPEPGVDLKPRRDGGPSAVQTDPYARLRPILAKLGAAANPEQVTAAMIALLRNSDITISRFASSLLEKELSAPQGPYSLKPGAPTRYMSLQDMKDADNMILSAPPQGSKNRGAGMLPFTPLLPASQEQEARDVTYPLFRTYKDHLYKGKPWLRGGDAQIFGALNFAADSNRFGYAAKGGRPGLYGDVTLVLSDAVKASGKVLYTNTASGRSYTNPASFVYALLGETKDIYGGDASNDTKVLEALCAAALGTRLTDATALHLEAQIFGDLQLTQQNIKMVVFSASVPREQCQRIMEHLEGTQPRDHQPDIPLTSVHRPPAQIDFFRFGNTHVERLMMLVGMRVKSYNLKMFLIECKGLGAEVMMDKFHRQFQVLPSKAGKTDSIIKELQHNLALMDAGNKLLDMTKIANCLVWNAAYMPYSHLLEFIENYREKSDKKFWGIFDESYVVIDSNKLKLVKGLLLDCKAAANDSPEGMLNLQPVFP